jgi:redox-sensitive bicupin YhaK (pirin superfamily)
MSSDLRTVRCASGQQVILHLKPQRRAWTQIARGTVMLDAMTLNAGDGAAISEQEVLEIKAVDEAELLVFDLA